MTEVQQQAIALLGEVWELSPDVRLGQLLAHLGFLGEVHIDRGLGYIEDDELVAILHRHRTELLARLTGTAVQSPPLTGSGLSVSGNPAFPEVSPTAEP